MSVPVCKECSGPVRIVTVCDDEDCCAAVGEELRIHGDTYRAGIDYAVRVVGGLLGGAKCTTSDAGLLALCERIRAAGEQ